MGNVKPCHMCSKSRDCAAFQMISENRSGAFDLDSRVRNSGVRCSLMDLSLGADQRVKSATVECMEFIAKKQIRSHAPVKCIGCNSKLAIISEMKKKLKEMEGK